MSHVVHTGCKLSLRMSLRKREEGQKASVAERVQMSALAPKEVVRGGEDDNANDNTNDTEDIHSLTLQKTLLERKLKNMVE